jgi:plasmid stability protein
MPAVVIRNLPEETHRALKRRAALKGNSTEGEIREILEAAVRPEARLRIGSELAEFGKKFGGVNLDIARDVTPTDPAVFE